MLAQNDDRYARLATLSQIGRSGLEKLAAARVVIVGCGSLGSVSAELLARTGVGYLRLVDDDRVELSNLAGQSLFDEADARAGEPKVVAAARRLGCLNHSVAVEPVVARLNGDNARQLIAGASLVLDGTDNMAARYLINAACVRLSIPWVFAAVAEGYGLTMKIVPGETPCYACVFGDPERDSGTENGTCLLPTATHVMASLQVSQALQILLDPCSPKANPGLLCVDVWEPHVDRLDVKSPLDGCAVCGRREAIGPEAVERATAVRLTPSTKGGNGRHVDYHRRGRYRLQRPRAG